jgi:uncharacterized protein
MPAEALVASILALGAGPVIHRATARWRPGTVALRLVVVAAIVALIAFHILPECVEIAGLAALLAATAGVVGPMVVERHATQHAAPQFATGLALAALALHAFTDGMALAGSDHHAHASHGLGLAIVLHRVLEGAAVWWLLGDRPPIAVVALVGVGATTALGFAVGGPLLLGLDEVGLALCQAFFGGVLLHVLLHVERSSLAGARPR